MFEINPKVDYGPQLNIIVWLLISISALFLFTRLYLKACQNRGLWWDDYLLLAAWLTQSAHAGIVTFLVDKGYGRSKIPRQNLRFFGDGSVAALSALLIAANLLGKLSFALTLLRLPARWLRLVAVYIIVTLTLTLGFSGVTIFVECSSAKRKTNCMPMEMAVIYNMFSCGKLGVVGWLGLPLTGVVVDSVLGHHGRRSRVPPLEVYLVTADEQQGKGRRGDCDEHGSLVGVPSDIYVDEADSDSAAGAAAMKTLAFPQVLNNPGKPLFEVFRPSSC